MARATVDCPALRQAFADNPEPSRGEMIRLAELCERTYQQVQAYFSHKRFAARKGVPFQGRRRKKYPPEEAEEVLPSRNRRDDSPPPSKRVRLTRSGIRKSRDESAESPTDAQALSIPPNALAIEGSSASKAAAEERASPHDNVGSVATGRVVRPKHVTHLGMPSRSEASGDSAPSATAEDGDVGPARWPNGSHKAAKAAKLTTAQHERIREVEPAITASATAPAEPIFSRSDVEIKRDMEQFYIDVNLGLRNEVDIGHKHQIWQSYAAKNVCLPPMPIKWKIATSSPMHRLLVATATSAKTDLTRDATPKLAEAAALKAPIELASPRDDSQDRMMAALGWNYTSDIGLAHQRSAVHHRDDRQAEWEAEMLEYLDL